MKRSTRGTPAKQKISVYFLFLILFVAALITVSFAAAVRHVVLGGGRLGGLGEALLAVAEFPSLAIQVLTDNPSPIPGIGGHGSQVIDDRFPDLDGFSKSGEIQAGALEDTGYLLLSSYDMDKRQPTVRLIRIADQQMLYEWVPDMDAMSSLIDRKLVKHSSRMRHPLLLEDGALITQVNKSPLFKIDPSSPVALFADGYYHHSAEQDAEGNLWVCSRMETSSYGGFLNFLDDSIAQISPAGEVLFEKSVAQILEENGYRGLLAAGFSEDPIHLNDIQPALSDSEFWQKGDLLLSMRHRSTIALYRPSTDKVIWLKTGPWMNQHDVDFINDSQISVFGNDMIHGSGETVLLDGHNNIYIYDFRSNTVTTPYTQAMKSMEVRTVSEGLCEVLPNGDVFIEESNHGRILRLTTETARWEFVRRVNEDHLSRLSWSRYLNEEQAKKVLPKLRRES